MNKVTNKLRVVHIPQVGESGSFKIDVKDEEQAIFTINLLANHHIWLFDNEYIGDYSNIIHVEMFDETIDEENGEPYGWVDYWNDEESMDFDEFVDSYLVKS